MAIIVKMPSPRPRSREAVAVETGAQILFFTGIRYEREATFEVDVEDGDVVHQAGMLMPIEDAGIVAAV